MEVRKKHQATRHENTSDCVVYEYKFGTNEIDMAVIELSGRYPQEGWALNTVCTSLVYIVKGEGKLTGPEMQNELTAGDQALIPKDNKYALEGEMELLFAAHPVWTPEQVKNVK
jgi:mannose-6-phosphate isomerase class I